MSKSTVSFTADERASVIAALRFQVGDLDDNGHGEFSLVGRLLAEERARLVSALVKLGDSGLFEEDDDV